MAPPSRPVLRYHGSKWRQAPWIIGHMPQHRTYVEPYGGAASVLLQKSRACFEVYNDLDERLVGLFRVLRDRAQARELERLLRLTPFSRVEFTRAQESSPDPVEQARRTIILAFGGIGSGLMKRSHETHFRTKSMQNTAPSRQQANYPQHIASYCSRMLGVCVESLPALEVLSRYDSQATLFYVDPPYVHSGRTGLNRGYSYRHEMTDADHEALAERLHAVEGMVVLSGYDSGLFRRLYPDWPVFRRRVMADKAVPRGECLWLSPRTAARLGGRQNLLTLTA